MPCHDHVELDGMWTFTCEIVENQHESNKNKLESNKNQHARSRAGTPGASYDRTTKERESQEDREARLDRQRLRTNHLTPGQRWVA